MSDVVAIPDAARSTSLTATERFNVTLAAKGLPPTRETGERPTRSVAQTLMNTRVQALEKYADSEGRVPVERLATDFPEVTNGYVGVLQAGSRIEPNTLYRMTMVAKDAGLSRETVRDFLRSFVKLFP